MMPLCFFWALMTVAMASTVNDAGQLNKRLISGFLGEGDGGLFDTFQNILLKAEEAIHNFIVSIIKSLDAASSEDEYEQVFAKEELEDLCPYCDDLEEVKYITSCENYCERNGYEK